MGLHRNMHSTLLDLSACWQAPSRGKGPVFSWQDELQMSCSQFSNLSNLSEEMMIIWTMRILAIVSTSPSPGLPDSRIRKQPDACFGPPPCTKKSPRSSRLAKASTSTRTLSNKLWVDIRRPGLSMIGQELAIQYQQNPHNWSRRTRPESEGIHDVDWNIGQGHGGVMLSMISVVKRIWEHRPPCCQRYSCWVMPQTPKVRTEVTISQRGSLSVLYWTYALE